jgi:uncharacterized RDD family membrane protein YckC
VVVFEDRLKIETPEGVNLEVTLAGLGSRAGAACIDTLILGAMMLVVFIGIFVIGEAQVSEDLYTLLFGVGVLLYFLILFGYYLLFETLNSGRTPGKAALGIHVIRVDGTPLGFGAVAIRTLLRAVDIIPFLYATGAVCILVTKNNQRLGDLAAGTVVARDRKPPAPPANAVPGLDLSGLPAWDTAAINDEEMALLRRYVERRDLLNSESRAQLATSIAGQLRNKVAAPDAPDNDEAFLLRLLAEKLRRQQ